MLLVRRALLLLALTACGAAQSSAAPPATPRALQTCAPPASDAITVTSLLRELTDLTALAHRPNPAYTSELATSFDRSSLEAQPTDAAWFANRDYAQPTLDPATVLLDVAGPGVVTRIWSANPSGTIRIYLDGAEAPALEAPFKALLSGEVPPFASPYAFIAAGGHNLYFPIPFARGCRITVSSDAKRMYYHVNYRRYAQQPAIETYSPAALRHAQCTLERTAAELASPAPLRAATVRVDLAVVPGQRAEHTLLAAAGGSVIRELRIQPGSKHPNALRGTLLELEFDGQRTVQVPLGDFFGSGPGLSEVHSLPLQVDVERNLLIARWPMPFRERARLTLIGNSDERFEARVELASEAEAWTEHSMLFGAQWHPTSWQPSKPTHDWPLIHIRGEGTYAGTLLNVLNSDARWWGEGDEKIFVDGASFPSHFGTGTEDYFGYGWCSNVRFATPFIGQTRSSGRQNWGATSLYRFHVLDAIPFARELRFDLEVSHWADRAVPIAYDAVSFYYVRPGARVEPSADDAAHYRPPELRDPPPDIEAADYNCGHG
ncbi:MAG TPA: glycoside hydrolase family 172 protein [Polyangiales bacterium]|nr:glycoside hydrolase family 172 protein [Polyangiales bacterium]